MLLQIHVNPTHYSLNLLIIKNTEKLFRKLKKTFSVSLINMKGLFDVIEKT